MQFSQVSIVTLLLPIFCGGTISFLSCDNQVASNEGSSVLTTKGMETLVEDGAWCWFSDPRATYYKGQKEQFYFGHINRAGDVCISARDLTLGKVKTFLLHDTLEVDDHNVPTILILPDGRLLTFYNEHNGNVYLRKSRRAEDISDWEVTRIIAQESEHYNYTYTNPCRLSQEEGRIYMFGRKIGPTRSFDHWWPYFKYSDDDGATWSEDIILLDNEGRQNPPYMKVITDHKSRIDFLFTDGHPKIGPDVSVYHMYYDKGVFYQTDGVRVATKDELPIPIKSVQKIYDAAETNIRGWIWDLALNDLGNPVVTYARYPTENDHRYHYAFWDGSHWNDEEVCRAGGWMPSLRQGDLVREAHYSGGIVLNPKNTRSIYYAKQVDGHFEIFHQVLNDDGTWTSSMLTRGSDQGNVRPYVVSQSPAKHPILLWMSGDYNHYTRYSTAIKGVQFKPGP